MFAGKKDNLSFHHSVGISRVYNVSWLKTVSRTVITNSNFALLALFWMFNSRIILLSKDISIYPLGGSDISDLKYSYLNMTLTLYKSLILSHLHY